MSRHFPVTLCEPDGARSASTLSVTADLHVAGPLVSCLMVTRGHLFPAALAIDCYRRQHYADRELVIVSAAARCEVGPLVAGLGDPSIRYIAAAPASLGELRNIGVAHARGELLCQWDDDDLSAPDRIDLMAATLGGCDAKACFLHGVTLWWPERRLLATSAARAWENTMLVHRDVLPIYSARMLAEDTEIANMILRNHRVALLAAPDAYLYVVHGRNAWPADHFATLFAAASPAVPDTDYDDRIAAAERSMPVRAYAAGLAGRAA